MNKTFKTVFVGAAVSFAAFRLAGADEVVRWYDEAQKLTWSYTLENGEATISTPNFWDSNARDNCKGDIVVPSRIGPDGPRLYTLDFPNREVRESFLHDLAPVYSGLREDQAGSAQIAAITALYDHDVPKFLKALRTFFSNIPYSLTDRQNEQMWQTIVYVILRLIGVSAEGEVQTNDGRIDLVAKTPDDIYIVEFKLDRPAAEAMAQIKGKDYTGKYALSQKRITLIGISFSAEKRTIVEELVEELPPA